MQHAGQPIARTLEPGCTLFSGAEIRVVRRLPLAGCGAGTPTPLPPAECSPPADGRSACCASRRRCCCRSARLRSPCFSAMPRSSCATARSAVGGHSCAACVCCSRWPVPLLLLHGLARAACFAAPLGPAWRAHTIIPARHDTSTIPPAPQVELNVCSFCKEAQKSSRLKIHTPTILQTLVQVELNNVRSFYKEAQKSPFKFFPWKTGNMHFRFLPVRAAAAVRARRWCCQHVVGCCRWPVLPVCLSAFLVPAQPASLPPCPPRPASAGGRSAAALAAGAAAQPPAGAGSDRSDALPARARRGQGVRPV